MEILLSEDVIACDNALHHAPKATDARRDALDKRLHLVEFPMRLTARQPVLIMQTNPLSTDLELLVGMHSL